MSKVNKDVSNITYKPFKKIFATVTTKVFNKFATRCAIEHLTLDEGFKTIVTAYAEGAMLITPQQIHKKFEAHKTSTGVNYAEEHANG